MQQLVENGYLFLSIVSYIFFIRKINQLKLHTSTNLTCGDLLYSGFFIAGHVLFEILHLEAIYFIISSFVFFIVWLDAILLNCYGMKVTIQNIKTFAKGSDTFSSETIEVLHFIKRCQWTLSALLFALISNIYFLKMENNTLQVLLCSLIISLFLFTLTKSKFKKLATTLWLLAPIVIYYILVLVLSLKCFYLLSALFLFLFAILLFINAFKNRKELSFTRSIFSGLLAGNNIKNHELFYRNRIVKEVLESGISQNSKPIKTKCPNANILLFTVESLSNEAYQQSPYAETLELTLGEHITVDRAYSVSPNTNQSLRQIYSGCYGHSSPLNLLDSLKEAGYLTSFLTTQNSQPFNMNELLKAAGFNDIIDKKDFPKKHSDYDIENIFLKKLEKKLNGEKSFIHILNEHTHSGYKVIDKSTFNKGNEHTPKDRYLNAVDESLFIINKLLLSLKNKGALDNTIVIITGDHGQSFGELGYYAHSSSTVNNQVKIPLKIAHPNLKNSSIEQATLLDLIPTLTSLIGLSVDTKKIDGINILEEKSESILLYSDTRSGKTPSNASVIHKQTKYYVDTIFNHKLALNLNDTPLTSNQCDKQIVETIVYSALEKHGLINH